MSRAMYSASARTYNHNLKNLAAILKKARREAKVRGIEESTLMGARLAPDMFPLTGQVMLACDIARGCCARLTGETAPVYGEDDASFDELLERIRKTQAYIRGLKVARFEGCESREIEAENPMGVLEFSGADFLNGWALPNFYFHCAQAYGILRHNGVQIGKSDWLGQVPGLTARGPIVKVFGLKTKKRPVPRKKTAARKKK